VITPESHHRYCLHEISSRRRRRTTYGLVGKRLLRVYARPASAAAKRIGKGRSRARKDDKRRDGAGILLAKERISASLICRDGPTLATARSGKPRRKNGEGGRRVDRPVSAAGHAACADFAPRANGAFVHHPIISWRRPTTLRHGRRLWLGGEPSRRRHVETDMNDFGRRAGGKAPQFGPGGLRPLFSELGAVVAATVVLGLAFVILS
jgi:hypothetical protein